MAVTTTAVQAVANAWTDLGIGPFFAVSSNGRDLFQIADVIPPSLTSGGFHIEPAFGPFAQTSVSHLWVLGTGTVVISR